MCLINGTHPWMLVTILEPRPCVQLTLMPPIIEQTLIYGIMFVFPHFGAAQKMTTSEATIHSEAHTRNPGAKNSFLNSLMVVTLRCSGTLSARSVAPMTQRAQPIQPCTIQLVSSPPYLGQLTKKFNDSFKKKCESTAQMTTDNAPIGVTRIASVKALDRVSLCLNVVPFPSLLTVLTMPRSYRSRR